MTMLYPLLVICIIVVFVIAKFIRKKYCRKLKTSKQEQRQDDCENVVVGSVTNISVQSTTVTSENEKRENNCKKKRRNSKNRKKKEKKISNESRASVISDGSWKEEPEVFEYDHSPAYIQNSTQGNKYLQHSFVDKTSGKLLVRNSSKSRRQLYEDTSLSIETFWNLLEFYNQRVVVDNDCRNETQSKSEMIQKLLLFIISKANGLFCTFAEEEGSMATGLQVGKSDESDYSVQINLVDRDAVFLSTKPFMKTYGCDDIDSHFINEVKETEFVNNGKRFFPDAERPLFDMSDEVPLGYTAVQLGYQDADRYSDCCCSRSRRNFGWLLPYQLLRCFYHSVSAAFQILYNDKLHFKKSASMAGITNVTPNKGSRGPAITLTIQQQDGPNISIDITPKLTLPLRKLREIDFRWPREKTYYWLNEDKIDEVTTTEVYLVPKGDKYWKVSFANWETTLLRDIDYNGTWRKACLRIMKKKLMQWKSKSRTGLKGLSSYLLKTTLLWLCEAIPSDSFWFKEELANRYLNFLQELEHRLWLRKIGEYFNPLVNLLENKDIDEIEELREFILDEIEDKISDQ